MILAETWKRLLFVLGGLLIAWLLIAIFFDPDTADDLDLALPEREIDPSRNPYPEIRNLVFSDEEKDEFSRVNAMYHGKEPFDLDFLDAMLKRHAATLDRFERYAAMPDWRTDTPSGEVDSDLTYLVQWLYCSNLKRVEAAHRAARGDTSGAFGGALSMFDFVDRLHSAEGPLIDSLVAHAITLCGAYAVMDLLEHHRFKPEELERLAERFRTINSAPGHFDTVLRSEYRFAGKELRDISSDWRNDPLDMIKTPSWVPHRLAFKSNRTRAMHASQMLAALDTIHCDCRTFEREFHAAVPTGRSPEWTQALSGNALGYELFSMMKDGIIGGARKDFERRAVLSLLQLRVAFERYRLQHGRWPGELDALLPDYLDEIPKDWMDGNRLRYDPEKRRIYSVGRDFLDAKGVAVKSGALRDSVEIVIELEPAVPGPWPDFSRRCVRSAAD